MLLCVPKVKPFLFQGAGARLRVGTTIPFQAPRLAAGFRNLAGRKQWIRHEQYKGKAGPVSFYFKMLPASQNFSSYRVRTCDWNKGAGSKMSKKPAFGWQVLPRGEIKEVYAWTVKSEFSNLTSDKCRKQGGLTSVESDLRMMNG